MHYAELPVDPLFFDRTRMWSKTPLETFSYSGIDKPKILPRQVRELASNTLQSDECILQSTDDDRLFLTMT